jgi:hypothetical protein
MRDFRLSFPACIIAGKTRLDVHDVVLLKTYSLPNGVRNSCDAMTLLVLNSCCPEKCAEWQSYFVEAMASYIVEILEPRNDINQTKLEWMTDIFMTDGLINSPIEGRVLIEVMDLLSHPASRLRTKTDTAQKPAHTAAPPHLHARAEQRATSRKLSSRAEASSNYSIKQQLKLQSQAAV